MTISKHLGRTSPIGALRTAVVALALLAAAPAPAPGQPVIRDLQVEAAGHSDVAWFDFFYVVEDHWILLTGTAVLQTPCGDRELEFQLEASGRDNFSQDTYTYEVDFPDARIVVTDPVADDLLILEASSRVTLRCRYPRPSGPPAWTIFGDLSSALRREFLLDCTWSALTEEFPAASFWLRPSFGESDDVGVVVAASGQLLGAIGTPVPVSGTSSMTMIKEMFRE